jgi:hypothetical protein
MSRISLSIATTDYDHFRDFRLGQVQAAGIDPVWSLLGHHEVFARFTFNREWDAAELSFAKFTAQVTRPDSDIIGLLAPVPLRLLLHQSPQEHLVARPSGGQEDRLAGMGPHRRRLHARMAAQ